MADDIRLDVRISPTLAFTAKRFEIDLSSLADEALWERTLHDPVSALTTRMKVALLTARKTALDLGHHHVGTEHVFLGILLDASSLPSQILEDIGAKQAVVDRIRAMLASDSYNSDQAPSLTS
jgi:hypothetical protein